MALTKAETQAIIADVIVSKKPLHEALSKYGFKPTRFSYYLVKYNLKVPNYEVVKICQNPACGKPFTTRKSTSYAKFCPDCGGPSVQNVRKWRKRNGPHVRKTRVRDRIRGKTDYGSMVSGWSYNEEITDKYDSTCQKCGRENRDLNTFGQCSECYGNISNELADSDNPHYAGCKYNNPISEMSEFHLPTPQMEG